MSDADLLLNLDPHSQNHDSRNHRTKQCCSQQRSWRKSNPWSNRSKMICKDIWASCRPCFPGTVAHFFLCFVFSESFKQSAGFQLLFPSFVFWTGLANHCNESKNNVVGFNVGFNYQKPRQDIEQVLCWTHASLRNQKRRKKGNRKTLPWQAVGENSWTHRWWSNKDLRVWNMRLQPFTSYCMDESVSSRAIGSATPLARERVMLYPEHRSVEHSWCFFAVTHLLENLEPTL